MDLWTFSLDVYGRDGVADACIAMQDDYGCDVPLLLFCLWVGDVRGERMSAQHLAEADALVAAWRIRVVRPLRALRRDWKSGLDGAGAGALEDLRGDLKTMELAAEKIQLNALADWWLSYGEGAGAVSAGRLNLAEYLTFLDRPADGRVASIIAILCAASESGSR